MSGVETRSRKRRRLTNPLEETLGQVDAAKFLRFYESSERTPADRVGLVEQARGRLLFGTRAILAGAVKSLFSSHDPAVGFVSLCGHVLSEEEARRLVEIGAEYDEWRESRRYEHLFHLRTDDVDVVLSVAHYAFQELRGSRRLNFLLCLLQNDTVDGDQLKELLANAACSFAWKSEELRIHAYLRRPPGQSLLHDGAFWELASSSVAACEVLAVARVLERSEELDGMLFRQCRLELETSDVRSGECTICMDADVCIRLDCCGVYAICMECATKHGLKTCPFCRSDNAKSSLNGPSVTPKKLVGAVQLSVALLTTKE